MVSTEAWYYEQYGEGDVLKHGSLPLPELKDGEVLIEVRAAGLNPVDKLVRSGLFKPLPGFPAVPGYDVSGTVKELGPGVTKFKVGDEVYGDVALHALEPRQFGTLAKHTVANEDQLALKPAKLSHEEAAALPLVALTVQEAYERGNLKKGEKVLITAGAGGVGTHAIQIAKVVYKAGTVAVTASAGAKTDFVKSLGADVVVDYKTQKFEEELKDYDLVLDSTREATKALAVIKPGRKVVSLLVYDHPPPVEGFVVTSKGANLEKLTPYFESGAVKAIIDPRGKFNFTQVKEAFEYLESGRAAGKVVITVK